MGRYQTSKSATANVVIIGGGVIGLSIARELSRRDVCDLLLIDRAECGAQASWAAGGILAPQVEAESPDQFFRLACESRDLYPAFAAALEADSGVEIELDRTGTICLAFSDQEEKKLRHIAGWQTAQRLRVEWLTGNEARSLEPDVSPQARAALLFPDDWQVENRRLVQALIRSNEKNDVRLVRNCEALSIETKNDRVRGVETSLGFVPAVKVIVAAGAWASTIRLAGSEAQRIEIEPVRGQMLCFKPQPPLARHVIYSSRGYLVPRRDGRLLAGSTSEHAGFDKRVTVEGLRSIRSMACEIAPRLASLEVADSWAGFRPHALDDLPILGPAPDIAGLFYATGHFRNGILLAPITAKIIADQLTGAETPAPESFSPNRFQVASAGG